MFTRLVEITTRTGKARELCNTINDKVLPILRNQPGFVDEITLVSTTNPNQVIALSFWKTPEDAERYNREQFATITDSIQHLTETTPTVKTFDVDTSTAHRVAEGKAA